MTRDYRLEKFYGLAKSQGSEDSSLKKELQDPERYKDLKEIGKGGMKTVYRAFDSQTSRNIALAKLQVNKDKKNFEDFIREARLTAKLEHPNIINIYDVGLDEKENPYFTMELKTGDNLQVILNKLSEQNPAYTSRYDLNSLLHIFLKICDGVDYAHSKKIIHLDLKPENIQVGDFGEVMICDWGICKIYDTDFDTGNYNNIDINADLMNSVTLHGDIKGSPGFMAPEQINSEWGKDPQTDVFSLGCLLYCILTYSKPFTGKSIEELLVNTLSGQFKKPSEKVAYSIPLSLEAVVLKAMSVEKEGRYATVGELREEVANYLTGYVTTAEDAGLGKVFKLFVLRNKLLSLTALSAIIVIMTITWFSFEEIRDREQVALMEKEKAEKSLDLLKQQTEKTDRVTQKFYKEQIINRLQFFGAKYWEQTQSSMNKSLSQLHQMEENYPELEAVYAPLGYLYFIKQDFQKCRFYLRKHAGIYAYMLPYLDKYISRQGHRELLEIDDFCELLSEIEPFKALHFKMLHFYTAVSVNSEDHAMAVHTLLKKMNPEWDGQGFNYEVDKNKLSLGGKGLKNLGWKSVSPLTVLSIERLLISSKEIESLEGCARIDMRELHIRHSGISDINQLLSLNFDLLERVFINENQFSDEDLKLLPKSVQLKIGKKLPRK